MSWQLLDCVIIRTTTWNDETMNSYKRVLAICIVFIIVKVKPFRYRPGVAERVPGS